MADRDVPSSAPPGRVVAVDLGQVRLGIAVSDAGRRLATPYEVLVRSGDPAADRAALARVVAEVGATTVVVGVPVGLDGRVGPAAEAALAEADRLREELGRELGVEVVTVDERLSTVEAHRRRVESLRARDAARRGGRGGRGGGGRGGGGRGGGGGRAGAPKAGRRPPAVDHEAAAVFLQAYLDADRARRP